MGKKLDAFLGRSFKTIKFRALINLAFSRLTVLVNQRQVKSSQARSDVVQLLQLGHQDRALLRIEQVIKDQNLLDVYTIIESYCNLLLERIRLLEQERECPEELKEAISGLIFASSRCGDFPELIEIRSVFTARFGKEFTARAIELRNNCAVSPVMVQKLSARTPSLEIKLKLLKQIASENAITLKEMEGFEVPTEMQGTIDVKEKNNQPEETKVEDVYQIFPEEMEKDYRYSESMRGRKKYKDVADAAQAAFQSAAYAAAAARAAVELSQSKSFDGGDQSNPSPRSRKRYEIHEHKNTDLELNSENKESHNGSMPIEVEKGENATELIKSISSSSSESGDVILMVNEIPIEAMNLTDLLEKDLVLDESDVDIENEESASPTPEETKSEHAEITTSIERFDVNKSAQNVDIKLRG